MRNVFNKTKGCFMKHIILSFILLVPTISLGMKKFQLTVPVDNSVPSITTSEQETITTINNLSTEVAKLNIQTPQQKKEADKYNARGNKAERIPFIGNFLAKHYYNTAAEECNSPTGAYFQAGLEDQPEKVIEHCERALQLDSITDSSTQVHTSQITAAYTGQSMSIKLANDYALKRDKANEEKYRKKAQEFEEIRKIIKQKIQKIEKPLEPGTYAVTKSKKSKPKK